MCLAVPGQIVEWVDRNPTFASAKVRFGGVQRQISMACVPDAKIGDYVLVHAGIAINRIDAEEAQRTLEVLKSLDIDEEWE